MDVLFIGGTGRLSKDTASLAAECSMNVTLLTRGSSDRSIFFPEGCRSLTGDIRDTESCQRLLQGKHYDVVVDYLSFNTDQLDKTLDVVMPLCSQYIFISSATVYEPNSYELISEASTPVGNPKWQYAWNKYLCERRLAERFTNELAPAFTIVRPYVTYGNTRVPYPLVPFNTMKEWSFIERLRLGLPVPTFDEGKTLTTITHTRDFAKGMVGLFANTNAYGEAIHITSDEKVTWGNVLEQLERALGVNANIVDVPRENIYKEIPAYKPVLEGDKGKVTRFDSSKIKEIVPSFSPSVSLADGIADMVDYLCDHPQLQKIDWKWMGQIDRLTLNAKQAKKAKKQYSLFSKGDQIKYMIGSHRLLDDAFSRLLK